MRRHTRAVSLVEILVAMFLISMALVFLAGAFQYLAGALEHSRNRWYALQVGYLELQHRRYGYWWGGPPAQDDYTVTGSGMRGGHPYATSYRVQTTAPIPTTHPGRQLITVTVSWHDTAGDHQEILETVEYKP